MIPGHGGIMDRFDCQFLMATFVNVYISSFIRTASPQKLLALVRISSIEFLKNLRGTGNGSGWKVRYSASSLLENFSYPNARLIHFLTSLSRRFTTWSQSSSSNFSTSSKIISKVEIFWTLVKSMDKKQKMLLISSWTSSTSWQMIHEFKLTHRGYVLGWIGEWKVLGKVAGKLRDFLLLGV